MIQISSLEHIIPFSTSSPCLSDATLWKVLDNNASSEEQQHFRICTPCSMRLYELKQVVVNLRNKFHLSQTSDSKQSVSSCSHVPNIQVGDFVGKYEILEQINSGGQGMVFRARDPHLNRDVAIKVGRQKVSDSRAGRSRIQQEGVFLAQIKHPHLARVYDFGVHASFPFLAMEYVQGQNLQQLIATRVLTENEIRLLIIQITSAISLCHKQSILHLDIKPENIMITDENHVTLIDFGVSWFLTHADHPDVFAGTLEFMSPEQRTGNTCYLSERSDIYGIGALLMCLMTGETPNHQASDEALHMADIQNKLDLAPYSKNLKAICKQALAYNPNDRFPSAQKLQARLKSKNLLPCSLICLGMILVALSTFHESAQDWVTRHIERIPSNVPVNTR